MCVRNVVDEQIRFGIYILDIDIGLVSDILKI